MRQVILVLFALFALTSLTFGQSMQKGDFKAKIGDEGFTLSTGSGERVFIQFVTFDKSFDSAPTVMVSLTGYDLVAGSDGSTKLNLVVDKITKAGCVIKVVTWGDCKVSGVFGSWLAIAK